MKYLNNYTIFSQIFEDRLNTSAWKRDDGGSYVLNPNANDGDLLDIVSKLRKLFDVLGFNFTQSSAVYTNTDHSTYNDEPINTKLRYHRLRLGLNVNLMPYTISNLITRNIVPPRIENKFEFNIESLPVQWKETGEKALKEMYLIISKARLSDNDTIYIDPTKQEAHTAIINGFIEQFKTLNNEIYSNSAILIKVPDFKEIIIEYLTANLNSSDIIIPENISQKLIEIINNLPEPIKIYNEIRIKHPFIYNEIIKFNPKVTTAGKLGEIGF